MNFRDLPNLQKFEAHARAHAEDPIVMDCYKRIRDLIGPVPPPPGAMNFGNANPVTDLKATCEAVEKSTRLLWACAAATGHVRPAMWDYVPEYASSLDYFLGLGDLELMAVTQRHRLTWEAPSY
jgi:hypothetical protein